MIIIFYSGIKMVSHVAASVLLIVSCVFVSSGDAQIVVPGVCQNVTIVQNFDTSRYTGLWYEYQRYFALFEINGKCVTAQYGILPNGNVSVMNNLTNANTGEPDSISGEAYLNDPLSGEAKLTVYFPSVNTSGQYWVLGTDYENYSVVWSCSQDPTDTLTFQNAWLLTREWSPSPQVLADAQVVIDANNLVPEWQKTEQSTCQWPTI